MCIEIETQESPRAGRDTKNRQSKADVMSGIHYDHRKHVCCSVPVDAVDVIIL